jgi:hypothetical protein
MTRRRQPRATRFAVGRVDGKPLPDGKKTRWFVTERKAATFIETLPDFEQGTYFLDGPEGWAGRTL